MNRDAKNLLSEALQLDVRDRAAIAARLLDSLDETGDTEVDEAWDKEIAERIRQIDAGEVTMIPWSEVRQRFLETRRG